MTPAAFLQSFPEFADTSPTLLVAKLAQAAAVMGGPDNTVWPAFAKAGKPPTVSDIAHGNLTAHYLSLSPFGTEFRLKTKQGTPGNSTTYEVVYQSCCDIVVGGFVVAGGSCFPLATPAGGGVTTGAGTASVANGSATVTFSTLQTFPAGTVFVFYSQPGVFYMLQANLVAGVTGTLSAPYGGTTDTASIFGYELP